MNLSFCFASSGTSTRSFSFSFGMITVEMPARMAARLFSFNPPIGRTSPRKVISPVMATSERTGVLLNSEARAVNIATPADGPSAGVAMFTALASLFSNTPVRSDVAMTGEITLRGLVLPIGGLKEKSLAAMRAGISTVIIPKLNEKDLVDVPEEAKQKLKFVPVENVDEVLAVALEKDGAAQSASANGTDEKGED